jgi:4-hydroxy-tetrahydrodipicolinate synthase
MTDATQPHRGVFAAALTPLEDDLSVNGKSLVAHYRWLLANGCDGIAVLGTTGEANSFTLEERLGVIDTIGEAGLPGEKLMVGTGCCAIADTVRLTRRALDAGIHSVLMLPPFYYKNVDDDGLYAAFARVIGEVADARLKVYIYHFPQMTGLQISHDLVGRLLGAYPATVVGLKDSSGDWANMAALLERFPGFGVFAGSEKFLLADLEAGGPGCISASTNLTAPVAAEVYAGWRGPDGPALQARLTGLRDILEGYPMIPALKALMAAYSGDASWRNVRPPFLALDEGRGRELVAKLDAAAFRPALAA